MAKKNFYAIKKGLKTGIVTTWEECSASVKGYPGAIYKGFATLEEAKTFLGDDFEYGDSSDGSIISYDSCSNNDVSKKSADHGDFHVTGRPYAFVDGSYNIATKVYGYGGFLRDGENEYVIMGSGDDEELASMRNVAGEILGSMKAVEKAVELGLDRLDIYFDYQGIKEWAEGTWKRNKKGTICYYEFMQEMKKKIDIKFIKVKGHSGVEGNERADALAKKACGVE